MEIQYAVFCQSIDFKQTPHSFKQPISNLVVSDINALAGLEMPLYTTFVSGSPGRHKFQIDIIWPSGNVKGLPDFDFNWPAGKITHGEVFTVKFQPDTFGLYAFRLKVDGQVLREITIPIIKEK